MTISTGQVANVLGFTVFGLLGLEVSLCGVLSGNLLGLGCLKRPQVSISSQCVAIVGDNQI